MKSTEFNEHELKQWYKGFLKDCPTGRLNLDEFQQLYVKVKLPFVLVWCVCVCVCVQAHACQSLMPASSHRYLLLVLPDFEFFIFF